MAVFGCDLNSRKVALAQIHGGGFLLHAYKVPEKRYALTNRAAVLGELYAYTLGIVSEGDLVYVESPIVAGARNIQSTIKVAAAYGAVLAAINGQHAQAFEVPVSSWKLATVGKGNASKDDVSAWLHAQHPHVYTECAGDQDLMDAACVALFAQGHERSDVAGARERRLLHQAS